jgi:hypothetical protein
MDTQIFASDQRPGIPVDTMSSATKPITSQIVTPAVAANADQLGESGAPKTKSIEATGGWDSYEVWRRFIKEARDRRKSTESN